MKINGWTNAKLSQCANNIVNMHKQISKNPVTLCQTKKVLLSINYLDIKKICWQDIVRDIQKMD